MLALVCPVDDAQKLFDAKEDWLGVEEELRRVVTTSTVGDRMFSFVHVRLVTDKQQVEMKKFSHGLRGLPVLSDAIYTTEIGKAQEKINEIQGIELVPVIRQVTLEYRGLKAEVSVTSHFEELELRWAAAVKERATMAGKLEPMLVEAELVEEKAGKHDHNDIDDSLRTLAEAKLARQTANQFVKAALCSESLNPSGQVMKEVLQAKCQTILNLDRTFKVEIGYICGMQGSAGHMESTVELGTWLVL